MGIKKKKKRANSFWQRSRQGRKVILRAVLLLKNGKVMSLLVPHSGKQGKAGAGPVKPTRLASPDVSIPIVRSENRGCPVPRMELPESAALPDPPAGRRPFVGYDREQAAYARLKSDLLTQAEGKFVVLVGEDVEGPTETFGDALRAGYRRFGLGPLFIKQVLAVEPVAESSRDL